MDIRMDPNLQKESESNGVLLSPLLHSKQTAHKPLSLWKNVLFAAGSTAPSIMDFMQGFYLNLFLLEIVKIHPYDVGILLIIKQLYDAVTDPLVGILSDNTKSRWGRRKPWIVIAIIPAVITFLLSWYNLPTPNDTDEYTKEWEDGSTILSEGLTHQASTAGTFSIESIFQIICKKDNYLF